MVFGWGPNHIWLHTTLEDPWAHYMMLEVGWDGLWNLPFGALTISWSQLLAHVWKRVEFDLKFFLLFLDWAHFKRDSDQPESWWDMTLSLYFYFYFVYLFLYLGGFWPWFSTWISKFRVLLNLQIWCATFGKSLDFSEFPCCYYYDILGQKCWSRKRIKYFPPIMLIIESRMINKC